MRMRRDMDKREKLKKHNSCRTPHRITSLLVVLMDPEYGVIPSSTCRIIRPCITATQN